MILGPGYSLREFRDDIRHAQLFANRAGLVPRLPIFGC